MYFLHSEMIIHLTLKGYILIGSKIGLHLLKIQEIWVSEEYLPLALRARDSREFSRDYQNLPGFPGISLGFQVYLSH